MRRPTLTLAILGVVLVGLGLAAVATTWPWPARLPLHLILYVGAGLVWAGAVLALRRIAPAPRQLAVILALSVALRLPAWCAPPAHSDDVYRYLWDGRVQRAGLSPYAYAPDAPELAGLRDENWTHINNRHLPTVYPPGAELVFRLAATLPLPPLPAWKLLLAIADLGTLALLVVWLRRRGGDERRALVWGWSPLVAIELGQNAHMDGLGVALLVAALLAVDLGRRSLAGALLGLSAAVKLLGLPLLPSLRRGRAALAGVAVLGLVALPYLLHSDGRLQGSLGEYGRRWRGNDGAFALLQTAADTIVAHSRFREKYSLANSPRLARLLTGRDRDEIYADEVAGLLARAAALGLFALLLGLALRRRLSPLAATEVALGTFLLLTPTLHPWYVLWIVPLLAPLENGGRTPAWLVLAALAPLGYVPLSGWLSDGVWRDPVWTRAVLHGACWALVVKAWSAGEGPLKLRVS
jgi:hypothetical protein